MKSKAGGSWEQQAWPGIISGLDILGRFPNNRSVVNLRRMWEGEEVGVLREWHRQSLAGEELLSVRSARFLAVAGIKRKHGRVRQRNR